MKIENFQKTYTLEPAAVDEIAERIEGFLGSIKMERANVLRVRLAMEEALLRWMDHFGQGKELSFNMGVSLRRPVIRMSLKGEAFDPLTTNESEFGYWAYPLVKSIGLNPSYSYVGDVNVVTLKLPKPSTDPAKKLILSIAVGVLMGVLTNMMIPDGIQQMVVGSYLDPVKEVFFRVLNVAAIPVVFLSVLSAACGAGTVADRGKSNRKMISRFILLSTLVALVGTVAAVLVFGLRPQSDLGRAEMVENVFDAIMSIVPTDIMTPFQAGNSPQLIFMAIVLGNALLIAGNQADNLVRIVDESYHVILRIADWVSGLTPFFVVLLLVMGIWNGSLDEVIGLWMPISLFIVITLIVLFFSTLLISKIKGVSLDKINRVIKGPFWTAFRYSSVNEAYSENYNVCVGQFGINRRFADYAIPLGLVLYQPIAIMGTIIFTIYMAHLYGLTVSFIWVLSAMFLSVALQIASPPVAGVNLLTYAAIFSRMGIPDDALILTMVADVIFCFVSCAADQTMLDFELVLEADNTGQLDRKILQKE